MKFYNYRILVLLIVSFVLSACITMPGHRHVTEEEGFYLRVETPSLEIRKQIRFNAELNGLKYLPETAWIKLIVTDSKGKHDLMIKNSDGLIIYDYTLNGQKTSFDESGREWFDSVIPKVAKILGLVGGNI